MRTDLLKGYAASQSEHYVYYYRPNSFAARQIEQIKQFQEESYDKITHLLGVKPAFFIRYVLCESSEEVGRVYGDNEPCNGFADLPDTVFAVYTENVRCIGPHEDTHLIAALIGRPSSVFVREGIAMYMDEAWWGRANTLWVKEFIGSGKYISVGDLLDNEAFWNLPDEITYPIAGAFTLWLIETIGMEAYLSSIYVTGEQSRERMEAVMGAGMDELDQRFREWILRQAE